MTSLRPISEAEAKRYDETPVLASAAKPPLKWLTGQYDLGRAAEELVLAHYLEAYAPHAAEYHGEVAMDALKRAIEDIGPEALGYQRIDRLQAAAKLLGIEPDIPAGGRMDDCLAGDV